MKSKKETIASSSPNKLEKKLAELTLELERKNRDLEIEAALERVRTVAMSMSNPDDLLSICETMFHELKKLGFDDLRNAMIDIHYEAKEYLLNYDYSDNAGKTITNFKYNSHPIVDNLIYHAKQSSDAFTEMVYSGKALDEWRVFRKENGEADDPGIENIKALYYYFYAIGTGAIGISTFSAANPDQLNVLKRFRNVFDLAYKRYIDITNAEAQAREAQIELALERVRARTMAMQHSDELAETAYILFQQFRELGEDPDQATIGIINEAEGVIEYWVTIHGNQTNRVYKFPVDEPNVTNKIYKAWKKHGKSLVIDLSGNALYDFSSFRAGMGGAAFNPNEKRRIINVAFFSKGLINVQSTVERSVESLRLLERFANVFESTYTRFLDLKNAEAQVREAQIEATLEKVRSRSLAMHQTDELREVVTVVFDKLHDLGIVTEEEAASIVIFTEGTKDLILWNAIPDQLYSKSFHIPYYDTAVISSLLDAKSAGADFFERNYTPEEKDHFWKWAVEYSDYKNIPDDRKKHILERKYFACSVAYAKNSAILVSSYNGKLLSEKEGEILKRFARVFEQAYVRFLDLHKAEAQAREAEIELGLERVRARSMAMQKSDELKEIIKVVYEQFVHLNIPVEHAGFIMDYNTRDDMHIWLADKHYTPSEITVPYFDSPHWNSYNEAKEKGSNFFTNYSPFEEKNKFYEDLFKLIPGVTDETKEYYFTCPGLALSTVLLENVGLYIENFAGTPYTDEENATLMRFGKVFQQTYTRFLDLQKAEQQAREAQIELGLERLRARAMAMQNSDELTELIGGVFNELKKLDFVVTRCRLWIFDPVTLSGITWQANQETQANPLSSFIKYNEYPFYLAALKAWKERRLKFVYELMGSEKQSWDEFLFNETELSRLPEVVKEGMRAPERVLLSASFSNFGAMQTGSLEPLSDEQMDILSRFVKAFDMTYTRFNDLKQAEAQAREAQIQLALERVRARTMAMQKSDELAETVSLLFKQLLDLGIRTDQIRTCGIVTFNDDDPNGEQWITETDGEIIPKSFMVPYDEAPAYKAIYKGWKDGEKFMVIHLEGKALKEHLGYLAKGTNVPTRDVVLPQQAKEIFNHVMYFSQGGLFIITKEALPEYHEVFKRFGAVFQQSYTRFLDLQKAEEQAREAQIEAALERVRSRTMGMQRSDELQGTALLLFQQAEALGVKAFACGFCIWDDDMKATTQWMGTVQGLEPRFKVDNAKDVFLPIYKAGQRGESLYVKELGGGEIMEHYAYMATVPVFRDVIVKGWTDAGISSPSFQIFHCAFFAQGYLMFISYEPCPEAYDIFKRFAKVFEQTYTRFLDLQKAEEQARESQIQLGLERVRAAAMAMHNSKDVGNATALVFSEFYKLGITTIRCGVCIIDGPAQQMEVWSASSSADGIMNMGAGKLNIPYGCIFWVPGNKKNLHSATS